MKMNEFARPFPLRTLMVCFTAWLIATEILMFDQFQFDAKTALLEQATRTLGAPHVMVPNERSPNPQGGATMEQL
jgi:hypothetical protein